MIEDLIADWPHRDAAPVRRMAAVMAGKAEDYWERRGRERFGRELAEDGLEPDRVAEILAAGDADYGDVLEAALTRLRARVGDEA